MSGIIPVVRPMFARSPEGGKFIQLPAGLTPQVTATTGELTLLFHIFLPVLGLGTSLLWDCRSAADSGVVVWVNSSGFPAVTTYGDLDTAGSVSPASMTPVDGRITVVGARVRDGLISSFGFEPDGSLRASAELSMVHVGAIAPTAPRIGTAGWSSFGENYADIFTCAQAPRWLSDEEIIEAAQAMLAS